MTIHVLATFFPLEISFGAMKAEDQSFLKNSEDWRRTMVKKLQSEVKRKHICHSGFAHFLGKASKGYHLPRQPIVLNAKQFFKDAMAVISHQKRNDRLERFFLNWWQQFETQRGDWAHQNINLKIQNLNQKSHKSWKIWDLKYSERQ